VEGTDARATISVAAPAHNEADALPELHRRLSEAMQKLELDWELVIADDGSTDGTRDLLRKMTANDPRVRAILLSRNFGHTPAYMAALEQSSGKWTVLMDSDLQDEPEVIEEMLARAKEGNDIVYAVKKNRPEGPLMRAAFRLYYVLAGRISDVEADTHLADDSVVRCPDRRLTPDGDPQRIRLTSKVAWFFELMVQSIFGRKMVA